jgi:hypothetical protein
VRTPEGAVQDRIAGLARQGVALPVGTERAQFPSLSISEVTVDLDGPHARALFHAEGQGRLGDIHVGYIGGEAVALARGGGWEAERGVWLPRLAGVLEALRQRDEALARGDGAALAALALDAGPIQPVPPRPSPVRAWLIRIEGEGAQVSEVSGEGTAQTTRRLELRHRANGWRFASGLL